MRVFCEFVIRIRSFVQILMKYRLITDAASCVSLSWSSLHDPASFSLIGLSVEHRYANCNILRLSWDGSWETGSTIALGIVSVYRTLYTQNQCRIECSEFTLALFHVLRPWTMKSHSQFPRVFLCLINYIFSIIFTTCWNITLWKKFAVTFWHALKHLKAFDAISKTMNSLRMK